MKKINLFLLLFMFSTQAVFASPASTDIPPLPAYDPKHRANRDSHVRKENVP